MLNYYFIWWCFVFFLFTPPTSWPVKSISWFVCVCLRTAQNLQCSRKALIKCYSDLLKCTQCSIRTICYWESALLQFSSRVHYYSAVGECTATVQLESALLQCSNRVHWYSSVVECTTTVQLESALLQLSCRVHYYSAVGECAATV